MKLRLLLTALAVVIAAALVGGPALAGTTPPPTVDAKIASGKAAKDLAAARARWRAHGFASYRFHVQRSCFCNPKTGVATISVRNGKPGTIANQLDDVATMPRLFKLVAGAIKQRVARLTVTYDRTRGYVRSVYIDRSQAIADEEVGYTITKLHKLR